MGIVRNPRFSSKQSVIITFDIPFIDPRPSVDGKITFVLLLID